jgi:hypothetical protein
MMGGFVVAHNLRCHRAVLDFQFSVMRRGILLAPNNVLGLEDWRTGGLEDWRTGGLEDWRTGVLDITKDIQSLTTFRRRSGDLMKLLRKSKRPECLR